MEIRRAGAEVRLGTEILLDAETSGGELSIFSLSLPAGERSATHRHTRELETFVVMEGELAITTPEGETLLGPGDAAVLPRDVTHAFAAGQSGARFLIITTPAGLEAFFREIDAGVPPERAAENAGLAFVTED
ncbi:MAG TPA: cupin domain-containing protein [Candidatus Limnocylindrales bacterium]|nr:cupin domain-containing protein [Candidatus Limnocylindrales bacterium]